MAAIRNVIIQNFRGFGDEINFDFEDKSLVLFTAPNGKGKTSLLDAIEWCLTGSVQRLLSSYNDRNSSTKEQEMKTNQETILKNKEHLLEDTIVEMEIEFKGNIYSIKRIQDKDTLDDAGNVIVLDENKNEDKYLLDCLLNSDNFYKYHVCDMQKTYRFLSNGREDMNNEFSDFLSNHMGAENVVANLKLYCDDIVERIKLEELKKVSSETLEGYRVALNKYENSPEIQIYSEEKLYLDENTDVKNMNVEQLNHQLRELYSCGFIRAASLLEQRVKSAKTEKLRQELKELEKEVSENYTYIKEAIKSHANDASVRNTAEAEVAKRKGINLNARNLVGNSDELIKFRNDHFTKEYWEESNKKYEVLKKSITDLESEISTLQKGNKILDVLTAITAGKEGIILYRDELRKTVKKVYCPVCGSERFGIIDNDAMTQKAQNYQAEYKELLEKKKKQQQLLKDQGRNIIDEQLKRGNLALTESMEAAQKKVDFLTQLYNKTKSYFASVKKLQNIDKDTYAQEKMLSLKNIAEAINENNKNILSDEEKKSIEMEMKNLFTLLNYAYDEGIEISGILQEINTRIVISAESVHYDKDLLKKKISSIRSYINNIEFLNVSDKLKKAQAKNKVQEEKIKKLEELSKRAKDHRAKINGMLKDIKVNEYKQVGPYLYKIFRKLSRDIKISSFQLSGSGSKFLSLTEENGKSILNMFSDGQLSVFMLSYFLGNILRLKGSEVFPVYFIDDITGCMDDINMLAFLDLIKYQLSNVDGVFQQLFFATCDNRIRDLLCWKMDSCGIEYKQLGIKEFEANSL